MDIKKAGTILINKKTNMIALVYREKGQDYSFPKGHIEKNETPIECAIRETEEETGRKCHILSNEVIYTNTYTNYEGNVITYMYLAVDDGISEKEIDEEDKETLVWVKIEDVEEKLTYEDLKECWNSVKDKIK